MKIRLSALLFLVFLSVFLRAQLSPALEQALQSEDGPRVVNVLLNDKPDFGQLSRQFDAEGLLPEERAKRVHRLLMKKAETSQQSLIQWWASQYPEQPFPEIEARFWLVNMMRLRAGKSEINALVKSGRISYIQLDGEDRVLPPDPRTAAQRGKASPGGVEPGLKVIGAPFMWKMGYSGLGRKALIFDTGIVPGHPALRDQFLYFNEPGEYGWKGIDSEVPKDRPGNHGTHVTGTVLGLDRDTKDTIGGAFNARFMSTDPILDKPPYRKMSDYVGLFQFYFNPDGDTSTYDDVPDVINNSWGLYSLDTALCSNYAVDMAAALSAAGIAVIFSAGNNGPDTLTIGRPAFINVGLVTLFAVGAVNGNDTALQIAPFSSRGPSICPGTGSLKIKPEVVAPGVNVRSAAGKDGYDLKSGTSMASPHVSAAVLLLKEAFPFLSGEKILEALYFSAIDLGPPGEENTYGRGIIHLPAAFAYLSAQYTPVPPRQRIYDLRVEALRMPDELFVCSDSLLVQAVIGNRGDSAVTDPLITVLKGKEPQYSFTYPGRLEAGSSDTLYLYFTGIAGNARQEYGVRIEHATAVEDYDPVDNQRYLRFYSRSHDPAHRYGATFMADSLFLREGYFVRVNPDDLGTWESVYINNDSSRKVLLLDWSRYLPRLGQNDFLYFPLFRAVDGALSFHMEYAYAGRSPLFKDSLIVEYTTDCGQSFSAPIFSRSAERLMSYGDMNKDPGDNDWVSFDTTFYVSANSDVILRIRGVNDYGGKIFIRKMKVGVPRLTGMALKEADIRIYPVPVREVLKLKLSPAAYPLHCRIYNAAGRLMLQKTFYESPRQIGVAALPAGLYILRVAGPGVVLSRKFVKLD